MDSRRTDDAATATARLVDAVRARVAMMCLVGAVLVLDIATKMFMLSWIFNPPRRVEVFGFLNFAPAYNTGVSFGFLAGGGDVTRALLSLLAFAVAGWLLWQGPAFSRIQRIAAGLIAGGALGNAIDRLRLGKVVDFIDFHVQSWHWPAFNIADAGITMGATLWIGGMLFEGKTESQ